MGDLLNVLSLLMLGIYLIKRGAYFETTRSFNIPLLISKSENVAEMFTSYVSNFQNGWHCSQI